MPYRCRHSRRRYIHQALASLSGNGQPSHIFLVAGFLRTDMVGPLLGDGAVINAQMSGIVAVAVAVEWASAQPCDVLARAWHFETEAQFRQDGTIIVGRYQGAQANGSVRIDAELLADRKGQRRGACLVGVCYRELNPMHCFVLHHFPSAAGHCECAYSKRLPVALLPSVVLCRDAESVEFQWLIDKHRAIERVSRECSARERCREVCSLDRICRARARHC